MNVLIFAKTFILLILEACVCVFLGYSKIDMLSLRNLVV